MLGCGFAAEQHGGYIKSTAGDAFFDAPLAHEREKTLLVDFPATFLLLVCVEYVLGRGEQWLVLVVRMADDP